MSQRQVKPKHARSQQVLELSQGCSQTQMTQRKKSQSQKISNVDMKNIVNKTVFYLLAVHSCKAIIKRSDIVNAILSSKEHSKLYRKIIDKANKKLKMVFGLKLVPSDERYANLMLINCLERYSGIPLNIDTKYKTMDSLLLIVLAVIFMNNDSISEVNLLRFLETLGFSENYYDNNIEKITDVLKKDFVNQYYLTYTPMESSDDVQYEYRWGIRAEHQIDKEKVLNFVSKIYNCEASFWLEQHMKIQHGQLYESVSALSCEDSDSCSQEEN